MDQSGNQTRPERREVRSICVPVPTIILNTSEEKNAQTVLTHSRSAGDLDVVLNDANNFEAYVNKDGKIKLSGSVSDGIQDPEQRNAIGLYCSPRLPRRSNQAESSQQKTSAMFVESLNACSLNCLDPGSRVGSSVSLNSEYTSRSVGLISNDSNSESSQLGFAGGVMEGSYQRHGVLKRFYSTPEKDDEILQYQTNVRRNSKSMGNMQKEDLHNFVSFDFGSDSTEQHNQFDREQGNVEFCDVDQSLARRTADTEEEEEGANMNAKSERHLVTSVTGGASMREGRIRKWLTEITDPDENSNS
ncbi:uncharacterized protein LOC128229638 [Mya arenaria]|uniref:uncharacterized protein LOC128229638 n=1 Tax=Mya arenaria TaxID=6604 RepID=UPI0022E2E4EB|nr:uncharacterized protein LOC128229638 [Mya arenaria]